MSLRILTDSCTVRVFYYFEISLAASLSSIHVVFRVSSLDAGVSFELRTLRMIPALFEPLTTTTTWRALIMAVKVRVVLRCLFVPVLSKLISTYLGDSSASE